MKSYFEMTKCELKEEQKNLSKRYTEIKEMNLKLDISRGKPCPEQLALSAPMLDLINSNTQSFKAENNIDIRNYGCIEGIPEARKLFGEYLGVPYENVLVTGNSTLNIFYDLLSQYVLKGTANCEPWCINAKRKILCPAPGYDRHFAAAEYLGFELVSIPMKDDGPDMDIIREKIKDPDVKCIICVPKYSNPQGITYSDEVINEFASLTPAAKDFKIFWDNAYSVHELYPETAYDIPSLLSLAAKNGNEDMVIMMASFSKITFPTGGLAALATSENNLKEIKSRLSLQYIGPDKVNQMRHVMFLKDLDTIKKHMKKQADILRPKFESLLNGLESYLADTKTAKWISPKGGYFISTELLSGTAKRTVQLCKEAGLTLTEAGSVFPYKKDPDDSVLRIAPSFATLDDIPIASELFCISARIAATEKLLLEE